VTSAKISTKAHIIRRNSGNIKVIK